MITFADALQSRSNIRVYGLPIDTADAIVEAGPLSTRARSPALALIHSFAFNKFCKQLPLPTPLLVWGAGVTPEPNDPCSRGVPNEQFWTLLATDETMALSVETGTVADLLDRISLRGIDGGLQIENPRYENGKLCATIHAWAEITIFGAGVKFDERIPVCVPLQGCYPVWSIEIAKVEVCVKAPSELCVQLCVGKWGLEKCWDQCVHIPLGSPIQRLDAQRPSGDKCRCND
ncbi:hypothetical protein ABIA06_003694 [Bradyrhizobium yuanmingense]